MTLDFSSVTERAGMGATREQLQMIQTRYRYAARLAEGRRVLELACGPGRGIGLIARSARSLVAGDYTWPLAAEARAISRGRARVLQLDGCALPFTSGAFDLVVLFEAIYYLDDAQAFVREARRVLADEGILLICSANREWGGFTSSAFAKRFYSARELVELLRGAGFEPRIEAAFPVARLSGRARLVEAMRRTAVRLGIVPRTLTGRAWLKRAAYGALRPLDEEITADDALLQPLHPIKSDESLTTFKVIFASGRKIPTVEMSAQV